jgi:hypothetical protein
VKHGPWISFFDDDEAEQAMLADTLRKHRAALVAEARRIGVTPKWMTDAERRG